jgi:dihydroorotase
MEPYDSNFKMKPPLRSRCDVNAVAERECQRSDRRDRDGSRAASRLAKKCRSSRNARSGFWVSKRRWASSLEHLVHPGKIGVMRLVELFTTGPARILGMPRGTLAPAQWRRRHDLLDGSRVDLRREQVVLEEPQW